MRTLRFGRYVSPRCAASIILLAFTVLVMACVSFGEEASEIDDSSEQEQQPKKDPISHTIEILYCSS